MSKKEISFDLGLGFPELLTLLFIGLKLTGYIAWPWLWVLAPILIAVSVAVVMVIGVSVFEYFRD